MHNEIKKLEKLLAIAQMVIDMEKRLSIQLRGIKNFEELFGYREEKHMNDILISYAAKERLQNYYSKLKTNF